MAVLATQANTAAPIIHCEEHPSFDILHLRMFHQTGYSDPRYAVSRPPMTTAVHNRQVAATILTPREETAPFASQAAASCFRVLWKYHKTTTAMTTSVNFTSNMPSARYCAGLVSHSVKPLTTWNATATQTKGRSLISDV